MRLRWVRFKEPLQKTNANDAARKGAEEVGKSGNKTGLENEVDWEDDVNLELWPQLSAQELYGFNFSLIPRRRFGSYCTDWNMDGIRRRIRHTTVYSTETWHDF
jgi:hypothetical protein